MKIYPRYNLASIIKFLVHRTIEKNLEIYAAVVASLTEGQDFVTDNVEHQNLVDELTSQIEKRILKKCLQKEKERAETAK